MFKYLCLFFVILWSTASMFFWHVNYQTNCEADSKSQLERSTFQKVDSLKIISVPPDSVFTDSVSFNNSEQRPVSPIQDSIPVLDKDYVKLLSSPIDVYFQPNSSYFKESNDFSNYLNLAKEYLRIHPAEKVLIAGHTDSDGGESMNKRFSLSRAIRMRELLVKKGIRESQISVIGKGESENLVSNDSPENKSINRRVSIKLIK